MSDLSGLVSLAERQLNHESRITDLEAELKEEREKHRNVSERELPDAMDEIGVESFTLKDGRVVTVKMDYHASIPKVRQGEAFGWLRTNGHDGLIKRNVTVKFGKGEDTEAEELVQVLRDTFPESPFTDKHSVHPQTLKAFVREQMEQGIDIPIEPFGIFVRNVARIGVK
jgi:hypothetical protein